MWFDDTHSEEKSIQTVTWYLERKQAGDALFSDMDDVHGGNPSEVRRQGS